MRTYKSISIAALLAVPFVASAGDLGSYNALVFGNFTSSNSDTEGSIAVKNNFNSTNYTVGVNLTPSSPAGDAMVVGGNVNWPGFGSVNNGNLRYAGTGTFYDAFNPTVNGGTRIHDVNAGSIFAPLETQYNALSSQLAALTANGVTQEAFFSKWQFSLTGSSNSLNVFSVSAAKLSNCDSFSVNVPATSTVVINIVDDNGHSVNPTNLGINLNGLSRQKVVFNSPTLTSFTSTNVGIEGSVLVPQATYFGNSNLNGQLIAKNFDAVTQINWYKFNGNLPAQAVPEPASLVALGLGATAMFRRRRK